MEKEEFVIIGAGILDVMVCPVEKEVFEKGSVPVEQIRVSTGGDALNEATILARLGKKVSLVSVVGADEAGKMIRNHCEKEGICCDYIKEVQGVETGVNIVMVQGDGNRSFFTNPKSSLRSLAPEHIPEKFSEEAGILCLASIFVSPLLGNRELAGLFRRAKEQGLCVCADMTKCKNKETTEDMREALSYIDYLFANEEEAALVTEEREVSQMADKFLKCGVKNVVIKLGSRGCFVKNKELEKQYPAVKAERCVDTTGAGDSFAAGFLCALSEGKDLEECVAFAGACGSLTVEAVGAAAGVKSREQVERRRELFYGRNAK